MSTIINRRTDTIIGKVQFIYNRPLSSSDLNELQSIISENIINYSLGTKMANNSASCSVSNVSLSGGNLTLGSAKFLVKDSNGNYFYGILDNVVLPIGSLSTTQNLYLTFYFRSVELTGSSVVYKQGLRTNSITTISETTVDNNIKDNLLNEEVSERLGLEVTFVLLNSDSISSLPEWSTGVKVATITISQGIPSINNNTPDINDRVDSIETNVDTKLENIQTEVDTAIDNMQTQIDTKLSEVDTTVSQAIESMNQQITNFTSTKGQANGIASLDGNGDLNATQVPRWYGTCATAAATVAKVVTCSTFRAGDLAAGQRITVLFTYANTAATMTLNVNGTGAKNVYYQNSTNVKGVFFAGDVIDFVYDGTRWRIVSKGRIFTQVNLTTRWSGSGPYTQTITSVPVLSTDPVHIGVVLSDTLTTAQSQKEAYSCISRVKVNDGSLVFYCYENKPSIALTVNVEVRR